MKPNNRATIILKNPKHDVPKEFFQCLLDDKPTAFGFAVQDNTGGQFQLSSMTDPTPPTMDDFLELSKNAHDFSLLLYVGTFEADKDIECVQPLILSANDKDFMAFCIEGDFPRFTDPATKFTDEYNLAQKIIIPQLSDIYEYAGGDMAKIMAKIGNGSLETIFLSTLGHRGQITMLPVQGDPITIAKNELGTTFDWGTVSQVHSFLDAKQEPEPVAASQSGSKFLLKKKPLPETARSVIEGGNGAYTVKDAASPGTGPRLNATGPKVAAPPAAATAVKDVGPNGETDGSWVYPPSNISGNENLKEWYRTTSGSNNLPSGWRRKPGIWVSTSAAPVKALADIGAAIEQKAGGASPKSGREIAAQRAAETVKLDTNIPIIGAKDTNKILDFVAKHLAGNSNEMINPLEIQKIEESHKTLSEMLGIDAKEMISWPISGLYALAELDKRAIVAMCVEMRALWRNTLSVEDLVGTAPKVTVKETATSKTTITKNGGMTKTESVAKEPAKKVLTPAEAVATPKTGKFNFLKKKAA